MITRPLISVVIPVYNVAAYISQTIESVIRQSIGFSESIEMILINDGSTDDSGSICRKYRDRFPDNITYLEQNNNGVSAARNKGIENAHGIYVHFLDGDDVISRNFYKELVSVLKKNRDAIDFTASKILFFDRVYDESYLTSTFKTDGVVDVKSEPEKSIFHVSSVLIRRASIGSLRFDVGLRYGEDAKFLNQLLYNKKKYGVSSKSTLYYRKRSDNSSAINKKLHDKSYFKDVPKRFLGELMAIWRDQESDVYPYMQHLILNDIAWKLIEEKKQNAVSADEERQYQKDIYELIDNIDQKIILQNKLLNIDQKLFILNRKKTQMTISCARGVCSINGRNQFNMDGLLLTIDFIHFEKTGKLRLEGYVESDINALGSYSIKTSKGVYPLVRVERSQINDAFLGDRFCQSRAFEVIVEIGDIDSLTAEFAFLDGTKASVRIQANQFTGLGPTSSTYKQRGAMLFRKTKMSIDVLPNTATNRFFLEMKFSLRVLCNIQLQRSLGWFKHTVVNMRSMSRFMPKTVLFRELVGPFALISRSIAMGVWDVFLRRLYFLGLYRSNNPIWLISDRGLVAGDNGEALFRHIHNNEHPRADIYFVISKKSPDYHRLRKYGSVVDIGSLKYKMLFLRAEKVISSAADYYVYNPFGYRWPHLNDLYNFSFIFLQHGVIKDDLSAWLNRFEKNIKLFVTSAKPEYESIIKGDYYYTENQVTLSGLPRFDLLNNSPKNKLMLAPTWRQNLLPEERHGTSGIREHSNSFKETEYYKFYNNLMNDSRIIETLKRVGMTGYLYLHPAFSRQAGDFIENEVFEVKKMPYDYKKAFEESEILVTDYSSVAFDFAYLKKPVLYTQFDKNRLYESHIYQKGYFSYENDGFGPVVYDYEDAVKEIVQAISNKDSGYVEEYRHRAEKFFYKIDKYNSKRVYEAILRSGK